MPHHIAILNCDTPVPAVKAVYPTYGAMFSQLFIRAASSLKEQYPDLRDSDIDTELRFSEFDAVVGELPAVEWLRREGVEGCVITGSAASAYDTDPWVTNLTKYLREIYIALPTFKFFGSCFGHQILAHALFSPVAGAPHALSLPPSTSTPQSTTTTTTKTPSDPSCVTTHAPPQTHTSVVSHDPQGFELGIHPITLTPSFLSFSGPVTSNPTSPNECRLQFIHADHVVLPALLSTPPSPLPAGFLPIGSTPHCKNQGLYKPNRLLTYQGHAEFDEFVNVETLRVFGRSWEGDWEGKVREAERGMLEGDGRGGRRVDDLWAAGVVVKFFVVRDGVGWKEEEGVDVGSEVGVVGKEGLRVEVLGVEGREDTLVEAVS